MEGMGAKIACSLAVVDRDQGGSKILSAAGCPLTPLVVLTPELFDTARTLGRRHIRADDGRNVPSRVEYRDDIFSFLLQSLTTLNSALKMSLIYPGSVRKSL